jgi:hypothetical protein
LSESPARARLRSGRSDHAPARGAVIALVAKQ